MNLGENPINRVQAYRSAVESTLGPVGTILEYGQNAGDWGASNITVTLEGKYEGSSFRLDSFTVKDNGIGMAHDIMYERFRGAFHDSESHALKSKAGRNGVGSLTALQYFNEIYVETSTKGVIPSKSEWRCSEENRDAIESTHQAMSKLKAGDRDAEIRKYIVTVEGTVCEPWTSKPDVDDSGTQVKARGPRGPIYVDISDVIRRLSHQISFLDRGRFPNNHMILRYPNPSGKGRMIEVDVNPFYEEETADFVCHIKGRSDMDMHILKDSDTTKPSRIITAYDGKDMAVVDVDIKVLKKDSTSHRPNDFIINICGANVYEASGRRGAVPPALEFLMGKSNFKSASGFSYRVHGYVRVVDDRLKRALRHNKTVLDEEDRYARTFLDYLIMLLKELNQEYVASLEDDSSVLTLNVQDAISQEFNSILQRHQDNVRRRTPSDDGNGKKGDPVINHRYVCNGCGKKWMAPIAKVPSYCSEFDVTHTRGCGSRDIERFHQPKIESGEFGVDIIFVNKLGNFLPARYEEAENRIYLSTLHPAFLVPLKGTKLHDHQRTVGIEKALFAIAAARSEKLSMPVNEVYGELLKVWFETRNDARKLKSFCKKVWKEKGVTIEEI